MEHLVIRFSDRPIRDTVRYLLYRAFLAGHPDVHGVHHGEEFTHRGKLYSAIFELVSGHGPDAQRMSVTVGPTRVVLRAPDTAKELAHLLHDDPVWGPDWLAADGATR